MFGNQLGSEFAGGWLTDRLRHYWHFDSGSVADQVGTLDLDSGSATASFGKANNGVRAANSSGLNGGDGNFNTVEAEYLQATVTVWVYVQSQTGGFQETIWEASASGGASKKLTFDGSSRAPKYNAGFGFSITSASEIAHSGWHHIALTFDEGFAEMWVDGVSVGTTDETGTTFEITELKVSASNGSSSHYANTDELAIFDSVLSESEIGIIYNGGDGVFFPAFIPPPPIVTWIPNGVINFTANTPPSPPHNTHIPNIAIALTANTITQGDIITDIPNGVINFTANDIAPGPKLTDIPNGVITFVPNTMEPSPVLTDIPNGVINFTANDIAPGPKLTDIPNGVINVVANTLIGPPRITSIPNIVISLTANVLDPPPMLTNVPNGVINFTANTPPSPPHNTHIPNGVINFTANVLTWPYMTTMVPNGTITFVANTIEQGALITSVPNVAITITPNTVQNPIVSSVPNLAIKFTANTMTGPFSTYLLRLKNITIRTGSIDVNEFKASGDV